MKQLLTAFFLLMALPAVADGFFTIPQIPDAIVAHEEKAEWLVEHYWEGADFAAGFSDEELEQVFVDYLAILQLAPHKAFARIPRHEQIDFLADKYLADPQSPMFSPALFSDYNAAITPSHSFAMKIIVDGETAPLSAIAGTLPPPVLLLFYDPDCDDCLALIRRLAEESPSVSVLAVNMNGELPAPPIIPPQWTSARPAAGEALASLPLRRLPFITNLSFRGADENP